MDIDAAASTPIYEVAPDLSNVQFLRYELTALAYHLGAGFVAAGIGQHGGIHRLGRHRLGSLGSGGDGAADFER